MNQKTSTFLVVAFCMLLLFVIIYIVDQDRTSLKRQLAVANQNSAALQDSLHVERNEYYVTANRLSFVNDSLYYIIQLLGANIRDKTNEIIALTDLIIEYENQISHGTDSIIVSNDTTFYDFADSSKFINFISNVVIDNKKKFGSYRIEQWLDPLGIKVPISRDKEGKISASVIFDNPDIIVSSLTSYVSSDLFIPETFERYPSIWSRLGLYLGTGAGSIEYGLVIRPAYIGNETTKDNVHKLKFGVNATFIELFELF